MKIFRGNKKDQKDKKQEKENGKKEAKEAKIEQQAPVEEAKTPFVIP